mmetsp:Transcript_9861/g.28401  ORF Transcript_9861/g.28401 Transcript_9861/m.28401 type:complete len:583 (+) Transcript_9861:286-2034(+)
MTAASSEDLPPLRAVMEGLMSESEQLRNSSLRALSEYHNSVGAGGEIRRSFAAYPRAFRTLLGTLALPGASDFGKTTQSCLFSLAARVGGVKKAPRLGDSMVSFSMLDEWLTTVALAAHDGVVESLVAMLATSSAARGDWLAEKIVLGILNRLLRESISRGVRDCLLTNHYGFVQQCVVGPVSWTPGAPGIEDKEEFVQALYSDFSTPPATWAALINCLYDALLHGASIRPDLFLYVAKLHMLIVASVSETRRKHMRDGLEDEICAVMSECVYSRVGPIMAILTSDEATPSLRWRASLCISLMFCYAKIPYAVGEPTPWLEQCMSSRGGPCERLLAEPRALRTIAESLRTGLTESPVQCESDAAAESLTYLSVFLPLALMDGGFTGIVVEAGFADTIIATMKHGELKSDHKYKISSGFTSSVNTAFASAIRHLTATEPKMMVDMGVAEVRLAGASRQRSGAVREPRPCRSLKEVQVLALRNHTRGAQPLASDRVGKALQPAPEPVQPFVGRGRRCRPATGRRHIRAINVDFAIQLQLDALGGGALKCLGVVALSPRSMCGAQMGVSGWPLILADGVYMSLNA